MTPKERADLVRNLEETVRRWAREEGYSVENLPPQPQVHWALLVRLPQGTGGFAFEVVRPKGQHRLTLGVNVNIPPDDQMRLGKLPKEDLRSFYFALRRAAFSGGVVGWGPRAQPGQAVPEGWSFDTSLYDDSVSQQAFATAIRHLLSKHLELADVVAEALGGGPGSASALDASGAAGYL